MMWCTRADRGAHPNTMTEYGAGCVVHPALIIWCASEGASAKSQQLRARLRMNPLGGINP